MPSTRKQNTSGLQDSNLQIHSHVLPVQKMTDWDLARHIIILPLLASLLAAMTHIAL